MADGNEGIGGGDAGGLFAGRTEDLINAPPLIGISVSTRAERSCENEVGSDESRRRRKGALRCWRTAVVASLVVLCRKTGSLT
jgi:hypothetical protein